MIRYIIKRVLTMIPIVIGVVFITFTLSRISPGDPVVALLGTSYTQEQYDATEHQLGLDQPFAVQLVNYYKGIITKFDLGTSYSSKRAVTDEIIYRFPTTIKLGLLGIAVTVLLGVPIGILSAIKQYSALDYGVTIGAMIFASMPNFWFALMLMLLFSLKLAWLPASGLQSWQSWILPALSLGLSPIAMITRMTRSNMLEVIRQDYITTARAKGLPERTVIYKHALRNALIPIVTLVGMQLGTIVGGAVIIESIFSIPGMGTLMLTAINGADYPVVQGCVLVLSMSICIMTIVVDVLYGFIDPRIKSIYSSTRKKKAKPAAAAAEA